MSSRRKINAIPWYGGKYSHLDWILPLLPHVPAYCEPFGGSAAVLLNRRPVEVETYNDLDGEVVNFFKVLREDGEKLIKLLELTPYSREEFRRAIEEPSECHTERARQFFIKARMSFHGLAQTSRPAQWSSAKKHLTREISIAVGRFVRSVPSLNDVIDRLRRVQIENMPAIDVILKYDTPDTLFYCDPPYVLDTRTGGKAYAFEMDDDEHRELAEVLNNVQGLVAFSNYEHDLLDELYPAPKWRKILPPPKYSSSAGALRQEVLWVNYDIDDLNGKNDFLNQFT